MSVIKVTATMIFPDTPEGLAKAEAFLAMARADEEMLQNINEGGGGRLTERSAVEIHRCFHDEPSGSSCEPLDSFQKPTENHRNMMAGAG